MSKWLGRFCSTSPNSSATAAAAVILCSSLITAGVVVVFPSIDPLQGLFDCARPLLTPLTMFTLFIGTDSTADLQLFAAIGTVTVVAAEESPDTICARDTASGAAAYGPFSTSCCGEPS